MSPGFIFSCNAGLLVVVLFAFAGLPLSVLLRFGFASGISVVCTGVNPSEFAPPQKAFAPTLGEVGRSFFIFGVTKPPVLGSVGAGEVEGPATGARAGLDGALNRLGLEGALMTFNVEWIELVAETGEKKGETGGRGPGGGRWGRVVAASGWSRAARRTFFSSEIS